VRLARGRSADGEEPLASKARGFIRTLARIAREIIEQNKTADNLILMGVCTRGVPLAKRLSAFIESFEQFRVPVGSLDISLYRDDLSLSERQSITSYRTDSPVDVSGKSVVLVDDVLYTGRSTRAAMDALIDLGRPRVIQLAVLVDRGHRELPIRANYVGKNVPSAKDGFRYGLTTLARMYQAPKMRKYGSGWKKSMGLMK